MAAAVGAAPTSELLESSVLLLNDTAIYTFFRVGLSLQSSVFPLCLAELLAGKVNYDITTYGLTDRCSASELHSHI